jgi:His-Xaa-Ser system radical SAM maturase HxsC
MIGIPLYADIASVHDFVVQADGAFDETIRGILNLKRCGIRVEIRVVIHRHTLPRLPHLAQFLARNMLFVDHVALMGLEPIGFGKANFADLWVDPYDYRDDLEQAATTLTRCGLRTSIYNHQLCTLTDVTRTFAVRSISDWKNEYLPACLGCTAKVTCGGFFSSAIARHSAYITPL